jgi:hypothetical protein
MLTLFVGLAAEWQALETLRRQADTGTSFPFAVVRALPRLAGIAVALILASGIYLAVQAGLGEFAWVRVSLLAMVLMGVVGGVALRPIRRSADASRARRLAYGPFLQASLRIRTAIALAIVYLMIAKPDLFESVAAVGLSLAIGAAIGLPLRTARPALTPNHARAVRD